MGRVFQWWKREKRYVTLIKALLGALLPIVCCLTYCAVQGRSIGQVYLPASEWNDELFYYKQVEGIVSYGYPQGYFGFNESHAAKLSFAAWSPVLVFPWVIWGLVFGWNLMSPILCNIVLMTLSLFLFVWLVRPSWKQWGVMALLFSLYTPFVRYMLSGMPEVICFSMLILFYGLAVSYLNAEQNWKLALLLIMAGIMTLMRPYMLLFLLLPVYFWIRKSGWKGALGSALTLGVTLGIYAWIKQYLGAAYFTPLFFTDWVEAFAERGLFGGIRFTLGKLYYMGRDFMAYTLQGFRSGLAAGAFFCGYLIMLCILAYQSVHDFVLLKRWRRAGKKDSDGEYAGTQKKLILEAHMTFCFVGMLFALLLMYKLTEGSKHLLTFMAAGIFIVALMETKFYKKAVILGAAFVYLYSYRAVDPYDYQVPFAVPEREAQVEKWTDLFESEVVLTQEAPSFDNVVIWVFSDNVSGRSVITPWQLLYGLPKGTGISCCMPEYVLNNMGSLQSRYLCVASGGAVEAACIDAGYVKLGEDKDLVFFRTRE